MLVSCVAGEGVQFTGRSRAREARTAEYHG